jgi:hypothetical protein
MTISGTPSRAISTAWACRGWSGATRRRTPASRAMRRSSERAAAAAHGRPRVAQLTTRTAVRPAAPLAPGAGLELLPRPVVHSNLAAAATLAASHQQRPAARVQVGLGERERLVDAQPGAPAHDDQPAQPAAVHAVSGAAHDGHDLLDRRRVRGVAHRLVARRPAGYRRQRHV